MLWTWWIACTLDPLPMPARPETSMLERWLDGPSWSAEGIATQGWPQLASSLSHTSGDVNGDGYADVAFGDPNRNSFGWVGVHLGGPTGPELSPSFTTPRTLGDQELGTALATCDMDGDGFDDLVTSDPGANGGFGRIWLYLGSSHGLAPQPAWWTAGLSSVGHGTAGYSLTCSDLDGDGDDDLVVGEPTGVSSFGYRGLVGVYLGGPGGPASTAPNPDQAFLPYPSSDTFGVSVSMTGDGDGDGHPDLAISDTGFQGVGAVFVHPGSSSGLSAAPAWWILGDASLSVLAGEWVGDVDHDGYDDLAVLVGRYPTLQALDLYFGGPSGLSAARRTRLASPLEGHLSTPVVGLGDTNGDGFDDFAACVLVDGDVIVATGAVALYLGSAAGPSPAPAGLIEALQPMEDLGKGIGRAGDVNGDGYPDVLVGAPRYDGALPDIGAVRLYEGGVRPADLDGDGVAWDAGDCDDLDARVHPGASEVCDGKDDDCDGTAPGEEDADNDGSFACEDCDDTDWHVDCHTGDTGGRGDTGLPDDTGPADETGDTGHAPIGDHTGDTGHAPIGDHTGDTGDAPIGGDHTGDTGSVATVPRLPENEGCGCRVGARPELGWVGWIAACGALARRRRPPRRSGSAVDDLD